MRVFVIGTGSIGRRHINNIRALQPNASFDVLQWRQMPEDRIFLDDAVTFSRSLGEALSKHPDLMIIANPSSLRLQYILAAIDSSIPFYVEKPILTTQTDLEELKKHLSPHLPPNIVGCNLRFLPSLQRLKSLVQEDALGQIVRASFEAGQWLPDWRPAQDYRQSYSANRALGGGVALDLIHEVDAARWLLGDVNSVHAQLWHGSELEIETEDCACMLLKTKLGPVATVQVDYVSRQAFRRYRIVGDRATAEWDLPSCSLTLSTVDSHSKITLEANAFNIDHTYIAAMSELLKSIQTGQPTSLPLNEGMASLEIIISAKEQSSFGNT